MLTWCFHFFLFISFLSSGLSEKSVAQAFWNRDIEAELRERGALDMYGMCHNNSDREVIMLPSLFTSILVPEAGG